MSDDDFVHYQSANKVFDKNGVELVPHQRVRFYYDDGCSWEGNTIFEDGVLTVSIIEAEQVSNPKDWDRSHDWIKSRHWGCKVGYGEYGSWDCPRRPLTDIAERWRTYEEVKPLYEKYGFGNRVLKCEVVGKYKGEYAGLNKEWPQPKPQNDKT